MEYIAKILELDDRNSNELNSPYRESQDLPPSIHQIRMELEIIGVVDYTSPTLLKRFFCGLIRKYPKGNLLTKASLLTTVGYRSDEEVEKYRSLKHLEKESEDLQTVTALLRLIDLREGELIQFSYPDDDDMQFNLIRYENKIISKDDFRNKSYRSRIDNTLEDKAIRYRLKFIGISNFEKLKLNPFKEAWFRLQSKYRFLIEVKQLLFYTKRTTWFKIKLVLTLIISVIFVFYAFNPDLLNDTTHRWIFILTTLINIIKELF